MRFLVGLCLVLLVSGTEAQYYYNDILATTQASKRFANLRKNKVIKIVAKSLDANNEPTAGFLLEEELAEDGRTLITKTATTDGRATLTKTTFFNNKIRRNETAYPGMEVRTDYQYDEKGRLIRINSSTNDTSLKKGAAESHLWTYDAAGLPAQMLNIRNVTDTTIIEFIKDSSGQVVEERWKRKNRLIETYYYYYDSKNQLTDIVRFDQRASKLLPDLLFDFDEKGQIATLTQRMGNGPAYLVWKYQYLANGLKEKEYCFDKQKQLVATILYQYKMEK
ncbi:MAG: hypothetical protein RIR90_1275 [Bacteroidota bacterium]